MRIVHALGILGALAACSPTTDEADPVPQVETAAPAAVPSSATAAQADAIPPREPVEMVPASALVGEWRIAGVDGQAIDGPYAITASIDAKTIHIVADCINMAWSYAAESGIIETKRIPVEGCGRGMTPQEEAIVASIDGATGFGRTKSNAMEIISTDRRVTFYSQ